MRRLFFILLSFSIFVNTAFAGRYYDAEIARFATPDPLALKYPSFSPYNYVLNNPLKFADPDGKDVEIIIGKPYKDKAGKDHPYGHMAIRVTNETTDIVYDFGRYGRKWGWFDQYGEGILNIRDSEKYISSEKTIRSSKGFLFETNPEQDEKVGDFFETLTNEEGAK